MTFHTPRIYIRSILGPTNHFNKREMNHVGGRIVVMHISVISEDVGLNPILSTAVIQRLKIYNCGFKPHTV